MSIRSIVTLRLIFFLDGYKIRRVIIMQKKAIRKQIIRKDAFIGTAETKIAEEYGLPPGCVRLVLPNGKKARTDKKIESFLKDWNK
jgi:hypothetical protein